MDDTRENGWYWVKDNRQVPPGSWVPALWSKRSNIWRSVHFTVELDQHLVIGKKIEEPES